MEKQNNFNQVQEWIDTDEKLAAALVEIQNQPISLEEQAELAFHKISEMYNLPKTPDDLPEDDNEDSYEDYDDDDDEYERSSVYQELGLIKYLEPDDDPRGQVLFAIWLVKNRLHVELESVYEKARENNVTDIAGIGLRGINSNVEAVIVRKGESWLELGCRAFMRPA